MFIRKASQKDSFSLINGISWLVTHDLFIKPDNPIDSVCLGYSKNFKFGNFVIFERSLHGYCLLDSYCSWKEFMIIMSKKILMSTNIFLKMLKIYRLLCKFLCKRLVRLLFLFRS